MTRDKGQKTEDSSSIIEKSFCGVATRHFNLLEVPRLDIQQATPSICRMKRPQAETAAKLAALPPALLNRLLIL